MDENIGGRGRLATGVIVVSGRMWVIDGGSTHGRAGVNVAVRVTVVSCMPVHV